jgi:hypothetical protein
VQATRSFQVGEVIMREAPVAVFEDPTDLVMQVRG